MPRNDALAVPGLYRRKILVIDIKVLRDAGKGYNIGVIDGVVSDQHVHVEPYWLYLSVMAAIDAVTDATGNIAAAEIERIDLDLNNVV